MEVPGKRPDITEIGAAAQLEGLCEVCEVDHVTTKANGICRECEQLMCDTCFRHHLKAKSCRQHVFVDTDQSANPVQGSVENVEKLKRHTDEKIRYYCQKHEAVGCGDCMIPEHVLCRPENIKDSSKGFQQNEDFESLITKFDSIMSANKENNKKVQESKKENENMLEKALNKIKAFRTKMNNYLDRAEESILKEAKDIQHENGKMLVKLEQQCTILSTKITQVRNMLDTDLYQDSARFIQTVDFKSLLENFEQEITQIQTGDDIRTFEFIHDKQLQDIITSTERLGSFGEIESQMSATPNTTGMTKGDSREELACDVKQTEPVPRQKEKDVPLSSEAPILGDRMNMVGVQDDGRTGTSSSDLCRCTCTANRELLKRLCLVCYVHNDLTTGFSLYERQCGMENRAPTRIFIHTVPRMGKTPVVDIKHYKGPPGTVTAVNRNGTVNVKWDATGETGCGYTMGLHIGPM